MLVKGWGSGAPNLEVLVSLSDGAAWPVKNAITKFRGDFEEYIKSGRRSVTSAQELMAGAH